MTRINILLILMSLLTAACTQVAEAPADPDVDEEAADVEDNLTDVVFMLDWVPNVNHTGLFAAQELGYFEEAGLSIEIIQPGEVFAEQAVAGGSADYGISFQEQITIARADGVPLVSIGAVIQDNTSGFASLSSSGVTNPTDWEGLTYGSFASPFEEPTLQSLMACADADFDALTIQDVGFADPLPLLENGQIDIAWIFFGTQGIAAEQQAVEINVVMLDEYFDCIPNYYTPIIITSEQTVAEQPEQTAALMEAISRGYEYAIENPAEAAELLQAQTPETDLDLLIASQEWLSPRYQGDTDQWGIQDESVWADYAAWMVNNGVITEPIDTTSAFTNDFLPGG